MQGEGDSGPGGLFSRLFGGRFHTAPASTGQHAPAQEPSAGPTSGRTAEAEHDVALATMGGSRKLLLYAPEPAQRQRLEAMLKPWPHKWSILPTSKLGQPLVDLANEQGVHGVLFLFRSGETAVLESIQLLGTACPLLQRFVICTPADRSALKVLIGLPPLFIAADESPVEFDERLSRAFLLAHWLLRPELRSILPKIQEVPTLAGTYQQVFETLLDPNYSNEKVGTLISRDPSLTAQVLKVVNSAYFALSRPVQSAVEAIGILGAARLQALVMSSRAFCFIDEDVCQGFSPSREWEHSLAVSACAQDLAAQLGISGGHTEAVFTAAVLHDLGKLLLAANIPEQYAAILTEARGRGLDLWKVEREALGFSHAELGACLLGVWGLSLPIIASVAWHHQPADAPDPMLPPLQVVHAADCRVRNVPCHPVGAAALGFDSPPPTP
jgi:putative nucleotidyltransferase with HDIG domain